MNIYKIEHYSHEGGLREYLMHENKYTQDEFNELVSSEYANIFEKLIDNSNNDNISTTVDMLQEQVIASLIENYGFVLIDTDISFVAHGWSSVIVDDWSSDKNENNDLIRRKIKPLVPKYIDAQKNCHYCDDELKSNKYLFYDEVVCEK